MIPPSGTFDYSVIVPEARSESGFECRAETRGPVVRTGSNLANFRLLGISPQVRVTDAGPQSDPGLRPPWSLRRRSRIALVATAQDEVSVAEASFYVDKTLTDCAKAGDEMHLSRNKDRGLGFSLLRGGKRVAAAGALTTVPLGNGAEVRIPVDLISAAESVFQERDPDFEFIEQPVEIKIQGLRERYGQSLSRNPQNLFTDSFVSFGGIAIVGDYRIIVRHGSFNIKDGSSESVSILTNKRLRTPQASSRLCCWMVPKLSQRPDGQKSAVEADGCPCHKVNGIIDACNSVMMGFLVAVRLPRLLSTAETSR
jgi:hypothetical protein